MEITCRRVCSWILNLLLWACIAFLIASYSSDELADLESTSIILFIVFLILYYIETFFYSYCSYFLNLASVARSYEEIDKMFKASPSVTMHIVCYHYRTHRRNDGSTVRERVNTHKASEEFDYSSWRDISGEFRLDTSGATKNENVSYVLLDLSLNIQFASDGTAEDYSKRKATFIRRNKLDEYHDFSERHRISYFQNCFLVQVTDKVPYCFGLGYFILFGLLGFNAPYSTYLDYFCKRQVFTIKKAISTRQNLNASEMKSKYAYYDPRIVVVNQMIIFTQHQPPQIFALSHAPQQYIIVQQPPPQTLFVSIPQAVELSQLSGGVPPNNQSFQTTQPLVYQQQPQFHQGQSSSVVPYSPQHPSHAQPPSIVTNSQVHPQN